MHLDRIETRSLPFRRSLGNTCKTSQFPTASNQIPDAKDRQLLLVCLEENISGSILLNTGSILFSLADLDIAGALSHASK